MKKKAKLLAIVLSVAMAVSLIPVTIFALDNPTLTVSTPDTFVVGEPAEFTVSTTRGNDAGTMVKGVFTYDATKVEKLEYLETQDGKWYELTGDSFGPAAGFPLMDATSKFRVTFKEAGEFDVNIQIVAVDGGAVILEDTVSFVSKAAPTLTVTKPDTFTVGEAVEYSVSTTGGSKAGTMVKGVFTYDATKVEKLEYLETQDGKWYELTGDSFGPAAGFPLMDATSKFRVTFKEAGEFDVNIKIVAVDGGDVILEDTIDFVSVEPAHVHAAEKTEAKAATCTEAGNIAYWYCEDCGKYFSDEALTEEITLADTVIPATGEPGSQPSEEPSSTPSVPSTESSEPTGDNPQTGSHSELLVVLMLFAASGLMAGTVLYTKKRKAQ